MNNSNHEPYEAQGEAGGQAIRGEDRGRSGVALILVIGMLALMVVLGVTFSIYMRTERVAAGSFKSGVVARQLLPVALNRALAALNADLGNKPYPSWYYLASPGLTSIPNVTNATAMAWIPRSALGPNPNPAPSWIDAGVDGRVGYVVVNCSGLLDANVSGSNGITRGIGTNVNEIQVSVCPDVANVAQWVAGRPYETVQELGVTGLISGALGQAVSNFVCYSCFPSGYPGGTNLTLVDLSGDTNALMSRRTNIVSALIASGIDPSQADFVFTNLLDYVDADNVPRSLGSACTESVPMFNEIQVTNTYRFTSATNFSMIGRVSFEWFYPFVKPSASQYWIDYTINFERTNATPATFPLPAGVSNVINAGYVSGASIPVVPPSATFVIPSTNCAAFLGAKIELKAKISLKMRAGGIGGPVVDATPYPTNTTFDMILPAVTVPNPPSTVNIGVVTDAECVDPRFNWDVSQWFVVRNAVGTLGSTNSRSLVWLNARDTDGYAGMFVADRPLLSVTELTYLLRGQSVSPADYRWNSVRLFDWVSPSMVPHALDRVLDYFAVGTNSSPKGFINPNSRMTDVLTACFEGMPLNNYPEEPGSAVLSHTQASALASFWGDTNRNAWCGNAARLSDIGHVTNVVSVLPGGLTPFQQEAFFRNTAGLFNTRQQYFKILLFAQTAKTVPLLQDKSVLADLRAVAEVWRDPLPNAEGIHPYVVRMVHVLNND